MEIITPRQIHNEFLWARRKFSDYHPLHVLFFKYERFEDRIAILRFFKTNITYCNATKGVTIRVNKEQISFDINDWSLTAKFDAKVKFNSNINSITSVDMLLNSITDIDSYMSSVHSDIPLNFNNIYINHMFLDKNKYKQMMSDKWVTLVEQWNDLVALALCVITAPSLHEAFIRLCLEPIINSRIINTPVIGGEPNETPKFFDNATSYKDTSSYGRYLIKYFKGKVELKLDYLTMCECGFIPLEQKDVYDKYKQISLLIQEKNDNWEYKIIKHKVGEFIINIPNDFDVVNFAYYIITRNIQIIAIEPIKVPYRLYINIDANLLIYGHTVDDMYNPVVNYCPDEYKLINMLGR